MHLRFAAYVRMALPASLLKKKKNLKNKKKRKHLPNWWSLILEAMSNIAHKLVSQVADEPSWHQSSF